MVAVRLYVRTHSLALGTGPVTLVWCASVANPSDAGAHFVRVVRIGRLGANGRAILVSMPVYAGTESITALTVPWAGEEAGYGWPEHTTVLPDVVGGVDTPSGLYALQVSKTGLFDEDSPSAFFVLSRRTSTTKLVLCYPFSTLAAYACPVQGDGVHTSLYDSFQAGRTRRVSLDRPFQEFAYGRSKLYATLELARRVEAFARSLFPLDPTAVDVCTSFDLHEDPDVLAGDDLHLFVSAGHDEYWSKAMRDRVAEFVAGGDNAAFFSANTFWWQVRFENDGRTMVCFKAGIEDPLAGVNDAEVTGNPAASPTNAEENSLTGASYRRGTQWKNLLKAFDVLAPTHPYLLGVAGPKFGAGVVELETDAAAFDLGTTFATGVDGSPLNFQVLAWIDARLENLAIDQRGMATLGVYTNVGTVFTAATTHWANNLPAPSVVGEPNAPGDPDVMTITSNVLLDLVNQKVGEPAWTLPTRVYPTSSWTAIQALTSTTPAITGVVEGYLVTQQGSTLYARDPENPASADVALDASLVPSAFRRALGCDLWGKKLYALDGGLSPSVKVCDQPLFGTSPTWSLTVAPPTSGLDGAGIAPAAREPYVMWFNGSATDLWRLSGSSWGFIGRSYPPVRAITAMDGVLYGVPQRRQLGDG